MIADTRNLRKTLTHSCLYENQTAADALPAGLDEFHARYQDSLFYIRREKRLEHIL
jgi:hypothetical protein